MSSVPTPSRPQAIPVSSISTTSSVDISRENTKSSFESIPKPVSTPSTPGDLQNRSRSSSGSTPSATSTIPKPLKTTEKTERDKENLVEFQRIFGHTIGDVANDLNVIDFFSCALLDGALLLQGKMWITDRYVCFLSYFGSSPPKNTLLVFPNAIEITTPTTQLFFGSFIFRDQAFQILTDCLKKSRHERALHSSKDGSSSSTPKNLSEMTGNQSQDEEEEEEEEEESDHNNHSEDEHEEEEEMEQEEHAQPEVSTPLKSNNSETEKNNESTKHSPKETTTQPTPNGKEEDKKGDASEGKNLHAPMTTRSRTSSNGVVSHLLPPTSNLHPESPKVSMLSEAIGFLPPRKALPNWCEHFEAEDTRKELLLETVLNLTPQEVFVKFWSDASFIHKEIQEAQGFNETSKTNWTVGSNQCCATRKVVFVAPITAKLGFAPKSTTVEQVQRAFFHNDESLVLQYSSISKDVPYGDSFIVMTDYKIQKEGNRQSKVSIHCYPKFVKTVWAFKGIIEANAMDSNRQLCQKWYAVVAKYANSMPQKPATPNLTPTKPTSSSKRQSLPVGNGKTTTTGTKTKKGGSAVLSRKEKEANGPTQTHATQTQTQTTTTHLPKLTEIPPRKTSNFNLNSIVSFFFENWKSILLVLMFWYCLSNSWQISNIQNQLKSVSQMNEHSEQKLSSLGIIFEQFLMNDFAQQQTSKNGNNNQNNQISDDLKTKLNAWLSDSILSHSIKQMEEEINALDKQLLERKELLDRLKIQKGNEKQTQQQSQTQQQKIVVEL